MPAVENTAIQFLKNKPSLCLKKITQINNSPGKKPLDIDVVHTTCTIPGE